MDHTVRFAPPMVTVGRVLSPRPSWSPCPPPRQELVIAAYQLGYGIAAFGAGPLQDAGVTLPSIFGMAAVAPESWPCCRSSSPAQPTTSRPAPRPA